MRLRGWFSSSTTLLVSPTQGFAVGRWRALPHGHHRRGTRNSASRSTRPDDGNLLGSIDSLRQDYFALRHGQSLANVAGIIMSDPAQACFNYGLSDVGKEQATAAANNVRQVFETNDSYKTLVLLTSDLLRAKETAMIVADKNQDMPIHQGQVIVETRLRERWFGGWEGTSDKNYENVWKDDAKDALHQIKGVESVNDVMDRTTRCILEWDERLASTYSNKRCMVVLAAHGDVLQILQTTFEKMDGRCHRTLPHLETAQLRQLHLASSHC